jgi:hypothetical protein
MLGMFEHPEAGYHLSEPSGQVEGSSSVTQIYGLYGIDALSGLLSILTDCRAITNWQAAYGDNPVLIASNVRDSLKWLGTLCDAGQVPLHAVPDEDSLPTW